jgi:hypothetical protein
VTEEMQASEAFTLKAFFDQLFPDAPHMYMWYSFKELVTKVL